MALAGCGDRPVKSQGEVCFASTECDEGLVCDFGADPAVCSGMGSGGGQADAAPGPVVDGAPDAIDAGIPDATPFDAPPPL
jgi:hypothetical protein